MKSQLFLHPTDEWNPTHYFDRWLNKSLTTDFDLSLQGKGKSLNGMPLKTSASISASITLFTDFGEEGEFAHRGIEDQKSLTEVLIWEWLECHLKVIF